MDLPTIRKQSEALKRSVKKFSRWKLQNPVLTFTINSCRCELRHGIGSNSFDKLSDCEDPMIFGSSKRETQYRLLFEKNPQPLWVYDQRSLRFLAVNEAAVMKYGYSQSEFLSMTLMDIRPYEDVPAMLKSTLPARDSAHNAGIWRHRTKDGQLIHVDITESPLEFEGQPAGLILAIDVTRQVEAEYALRRSEQKYRELVDNARMGIYRSNKEGFLSDANPALVTLLGYATKEELIGRRLDCEIYVKVEDRDLILRRAESEFQVDAEVSWKRKDGNIIIVRLFGQTIRADDGGISHYDVMVEDITQQRLMERQLRQAQKMEAVGQLASGVAHDFNNLLMVMMAAANMIQNSPSNQATVSKYADQVVQASKRAAELTNQLLAFSRQQPQRLAALDVNSVVSEFCKLLPKLIGEHIQFTLVPNQEPCRVLADRGQLEQVIMNPVVNARDAMPNGGKIIVETNNFSLDENYAQLHGADVPPGPYVMLSVSDTGCGMDEATRAKIFEPFFTTKEQGKGTGLGLATVYGIVKQS